MLLLLCFPPLLLLKNICVLADRNTLCRPLHTSYKINAFIKWTHVYTFDWCAQSMFACSRKWAFCPTWPQTEWWIIFFCAHGRSLQAVLVCCQYWRQSIWLQICFYLEKDVQSFVWNGVLQIFSYVSSCRSLIHFLHVYKHIYRVLWWHILGTKEGCIIHIASINPYVLLGTFSSTKGCCWVLIWPQLFLCFSKWNDFWWQILF